MLKKREQRYLLITDKLVLIVEPDLYRMDYAVVHNWGSTLQLQSAVHNFDSSRCATPHSLSGM